MKRLLLYGALSVGALLQARDIDIKNSIILLPEIGEVISSGSPVIMGIVKDNQGRPLKNRKITIFLDQRVVGIVPTNNDGVFSYQMRDDQQLSNGIHTAQAFIEINQSRISWVQGTLFTVDTARSGIYRSGNVSPNHSFINFPFQGSFVNTTKPTIVGCLREPNNNPVSGESVRILVDGSIVATVTSGNNGIFSYTLTNAQQLSNGSHTAGVFCVQTGISLTSVSFTIDTVAPVAPVITVPAQGSTVTTAEVSVEGTTEPDATVITFMDGDTNGDITYADANGVWAALYVLNNGSHSVLAQAEDTAGNLGVSSSERTFSTNA